MKEPELEPLSGGSATAKQGFLLFFITPLLSLFIIFVLILYFSAITLIVSMIIIGALMIFIRQSLAYADIYFSGDNLIIKKVTGTKIRPITDAKTVDEAFSAVNYYIIFKDETKIYFTLNLKDFFKRYGSSGNISNIIAERFRERIKAAQA